MIICPRTGKQYPDEYFTSLKKCTKCGGLINIRTEGWRGDPDGSRPFHGNDCPPARVVAAPLPSNVVAAAPAKKLTGRELLERNDWYKRNVLDKEIK